MLDNREHIVNICNAILKTAPLDNPMALYRYLYVSTKVNQKVSNRGLLPILLSMIFPTYFQSASTRDVDIGLRC